MSFTDQNDSDNYMTLESSWSNITDYIPKDKIIYEPFYGDGTSGEFLRKLGCKKVIHEDTDFFENSFEYDMIISNPPFRFKKQIFQRLKEIGKPFIMICPITTLGYKYFLDNYTNEIQLIVPAKRMKFRKLNTDNAKYAPPFSTFYFCYKMNLPKDLIFI